MTKLVYCLPSSGVFLCSAVLTRSGHAIFITGLPGYPGSNITGVPELFFLITYKWVYWSSQYCTLILFSICPSIHLVTPRKGVYLADTVYWIDGGQHKLNNCS